MDYSCLSARTSALGLLFALGCSGESGGEATSQTEPLPVLAAEAAAWDAQVPTAGGGIGSVRSRAYGALSRGSVSDVRRSVVELDLATAIDPKDGYAMFYSGALRLMLLAESSTLADVIEAPIRLSEVLTRLDKAHGLLPDDFRVTSFLALSQTMAGGLLGDSKLLDDGRDMFELGFEQHEPYGHFLRATALAPLARDDPKFELAVSDMLAAATGCGFPDGDATARYRYPSDPTSNVSPNVCLNEGIVPHVWEGFLIAYGDIALKAGWKAEEARALYRSAQSAPSYDTWPFADVLEARIEDADNRAKAYQDQNPFNDPELWAAKICAGCHQRGE